MIIWVLGSKGGSEMGFYAWIRGRTATVVALYIT
jgi:hypothetical protein